MARKKKAEKLAYMIVEWECGRCGTVLGCLWEEGVDEMQNKMCPTCHTHMGWGKVKEIVE